ncbi:MAG: hypothetical protein M1377_06085 [Deltaproteobacteria bacterium]|nr:hypothetical protein [Deltaproteobacteria bacterium]
MKYFAVYNTITGSIRRHGSCPDADLAHQAHNAGEGVVEATAPITNENTVVDGVPVYVDPGPPPAPTPEQVAEMEEVEFLRDLAMRMGKAVFNHENRIRVLEGKPAATWVQFKAAIRGL